jgi:hypothetical protein
MEGISTANDQGTLSTACEAWKPVRSRRVTLLLLGIIALSAADLAVTLAFLRAQWMMEANPIAAYLIQTTQSAWALALFKACSVGTCVAVLYRLRRSMAGEVAAWLSIAILTVMSVMWHAYARHLDAHEEILLAQIGSCTDDRLALP